MRAKKHLAWIAVFVLFFPSMALAWGSAVHAYIDDHLSHKLGTKNYNELYGGMVPDMFNFLFGHPYYSEICLAAHSDFESIWDNAKPGIEEAVSYGFVTHNDMWGADYTAHHSGVIIGQGSGYVIAKAQMLSTLVSLPPELGVPDALALELYHSVVEYALDILITRADPKIGSKICDSALTRTSTFPDLLAETWADDFAVYFGNSSEAAADAIERTENEFRQMMVVYGQALMQDEEIAIALITQQLADMAEAFLAVYGIALPEGTDLKPLAGACMSASIALCEADYMTEIAATVNYVDQQMAVNGFLYR